MIMNKTLNDKQWYENKTKQESETKEMKNDEMKWTDNEIGAEGEKMISEALMINTTLTKLDLWCE